MRKICSWLVSAVLFVSSTFALFGCGSKKSESELIVVDGAFNQACMFSMDLEHESELQPIDDFSALLIKLIYQDEEIQKLFLNATKPSDMFGRRNIFFLPDGSCIMNSKSSDRICEYAKSVADTFYPGKTEKEIDEEIEKGDITTGGYCVDTTDEENKYIIRTSLNMQIYTYDASLKQLIGSEKFKEEYYVNKKVETIPDVPKEKGGYDAITTDGEKEAAYLKNGDYEVLSEVFREKTIGATFFRHKVWYPSEMTHSDKKYPLIVMSNGSGSMFSAYEYSFEHLASWGFIVIGNDEQSNGNGHASESSLNLMIKLNADESSKFYGKIDIDKVGSAGHSQGGAGAVNAVLRYGHSENYKAIYTASNTNSALSDYLGWGYDPSAIKAAYFGVAGTGNTDAGDATKEGLAPLAKLQETYSGIDNEVKKIIARRKGADHAEMLYYGDGYMTAWFLWHLQGDTKAQAAFDEIVKNDKWQDISKNF